MTMGDQRLDDDPSHRRTRTTTQRSTLRSSSFGWDPNLGRPNIDAFFTLTKKPGDFLTKKQS